jgi:hypothetical protein
MASPPRRPTPKGSHGRIGTPVVVRSALLGTLLAVVVSVAIAAVPASTTDPSTGTLSASGFNG